MAYDIPTGFVIRHRQLQIDLITATDVTASVLKILRCFDLLFSLLRSYMKKMVSDT